MTESTRKLNGKAITVKAGKFTAMRSTGTKGAIAANRNDAFQRKLRIALYSLQVATIGKVRFIGKERELGRIGKSRKTPRGIPAGRAGAKLAETIRGYIERNYGERSEA